MGMNAGGPETIRPSLKKAISGMASNMAFFVNGTSLDDCGAGIHAILCLEIV